MTLKPHNVSVPAVPATRISASRDCTAGDKKDRERRGRDEGGRWGADQTLTYAASAAGMAQVMKLTGAYSRANEDES